MAHQGPHSAQAAQLLAAVAQLLAAWQRTTAVHAEVDELRASFTPEVRSALEQEARGLDVAPPAGETPPPGTTTNPADEVQTSALPPAGPAEPPSP